MKFVSWNVNGFKACLNNGFMDYFNQANADFFCIQETKMQEDNCNFDLKNYEQYWSFCERKGLSGTAIFTKHIPNDVLYGMDNPSFDSEGRLITLEYDHFYLMNVYVPNSKNSAERMGYRLDWDDTFKKFVSELNCKKPLVICGDMNVTSLDIDFKTNNDTNLNFGFTEEERADFHELLEDVGLKDSFRLLNPNQKEAYTFFPYRRRNKDKHLGFRLDYFLISDYLTDKLNDSYIDAKVKGSDHCPIVLELF